MKLIAGLGNPGKGYKYNRHNIGFRVTDALASKYGVRFKRKLFKKVRCANLKFFGEWITIIQPLTFMNLSGGCILQFCKAKRINFSDLMVICDDINLLLPKIRMRPSGSAGGHNGLVSIIESLGTGDFPRLRIGITAAEPPEDLSQHVLSDFKDSEKALVDKAIKLAVSACECWVKEGIEAAMNRFN